MNRLYSLLTYSIDLASSASYYKKLCFPARHTPKSREICNELMKNVPQGRLLMFTCFICNEVMNTMFGEEIKELDRENTYSEFSRDPNAAIGDLLIYDLTCPPKDLQYLYTYLDDDIRERLIVPEWLDVIAAVCLQILREAA